MLRISAAEKPEDYEQGRSLFIEYSAGLGFSLCFQEFDRELAEIAIQYGPPSGRLLLGSLPAGPVGCVGVRRFSGDICEMKRLYVRMGYRRQGIGRRLAIASLQAAHDLGYLRMRLDTVAKMIEALALYRTLGFTEIEPYRPNPMPEVKYLEVLL
jgi:GNAT superfamily N-acetyltransferase